MGERGRHRQPLSPTPKMIIILDINPIPYFFGIIYSLEVPYLTSLDCDACKLGQAIRLHWSFENGLHWTLDVTFNETLAASVLVMLHKICHCCVELQLTH